MTKLFDPREVQERKVLNSAQTDKCDRSLADTDLAMNQASHRRLIMNMTGIVDHPELFQQSSHERVDSRLGLQC